MKIRKILAVVLTTAVLMSGMSGDLSMYANAAATDETGVEMARIEAEASICHGYQANDTGVGGASTQQYTYEEMAQFLDKGGNGDDKKEKYTSYVQYAVTAPEDGEYRIKVGFDVGTTDSDPGSWSEDPYIAVLVNGQQAYQAIMPKTSVNTGTQGIPLTVTLKKGLNLIRCTGLPKGQPAYELDAADNGIWVWVNHDYLDIDGRLTAASTAQTTANATDGMFHNYTGNADGTIGAAASGEAQTNKVSIAGITAGNIGYCPYVAWKVNAPADGYYDITLNGANDPADGTKCVAMILDGGVREHKIHVNGSWKTTIDASCYLTAGEHILVFTSPMPRNSEEAEGFSYSWMDYWNIELGNGLTVANDLTKDEVTASLVKRIEAEASVCHGYQANDTGAGGASPQQYTYEEMAQFLDKGGNGDDKKEKYTSYVQYAVTAPEDGEYRIKVGFDVGTTDSDPGSWSEDPYIAVLVNGQQAYQAIMPKTSVNTGTQGIPLTVTLKKGLNLIRCTGLPKGQPAYELDAADNGIWVWVNHDYLDIDGRLTEARIEQTTANATDGVFHNYTGNTDGTVGDATSGEAQTNKVSIAGITAGNIGYCPYVAWKVNAPADGYYDITLNGMNEPADGKKCVAMIIDGGVREQKIHVNGSWRTTIDASCYLTAGEHILVFTSPMPKNSEEAEGFSYSWMNYYNIELGNGLTVANDLTKDEITASLGIVQKTGEYTGISEKMEDTFAVLSGTLKLTGGLKDYAGWPSVNLQLIADNESRYTNNFQLLYAAERKNDGGYIGIKITDSSNRDNHDGVTVDENQEPDQNIELLNKIFTDDGLPFKIIRLNNWAYFLADTGDGYQIIARMNGLGDRPTSFALHNGDLLEQNRVMLMDYNVAAGKEAALEALAGSRFSFKDRKDLASVEDSMYFPVDSTEWTLQARVSLPDYSNYTGAEHRAVHVGPGPRFDGNTPYAWARGLGLVYQNNEWGTGWKIQKLEVDWNANFIDTAHAEMMDPDRGGMWIQWVRKGDKLSVNTSADGQNWNNILERADLGDMDAGATGMYIDSACKADLTDICITLGKGTPVGSTVSLGDNIGVNFYTQLSEETIADENAYVEFTHPDMNHTKTKVYVKDTEVKTFNGATCYVFPCNIAAKEMASDIKLKIVSGDGSEGAEYTYTVKKYGDKILADTSGSYTNDDKAMVKAMLNYGAYAQKHFKYDDNKLANAGMEEEDQKLQAVTFNENDYKKNIEGSCSGLKYYGTSLMTTTKTAIRHYFEMTDGAVIGDFTFSYEENVLEPKEKDGRYYVEISNIAASGLGGMYKLTVSKSNESMTLTYGPYTNVKAILNGNYSDDAKNMMKALYWYGQTAAEYAQTSATLRTALQGKYLSILGDSISTFTGVSNSAANNTTLGGSVEYDGSKGNVTSMDHTYWGRMLAKYDMKLLVDNAAGGSLLLEDGGYQISVPAGYKRVEQLAANTGSLNGTQPDVIFVHMGTNDYINHKTLGECTDSTYTDIHEGDGYKTPVTFTEAYIITLEKIKKLYPEADVFCFTLTPSDWNKDFTMLDAYNARIREIADRYENVTLVDTTGAINTGNYTSLTYDNTHPNKDGMTAIANKLEASLIDRYVKKKIALSHEELMRGGSYDGSLFYRNDYKVGVADPFVFDNTKRDGYYYMYGTELICRRSKNLTDWEEVPYTNCLDSIRGSIPNGSDIIYTDVWAPEVIYDKETNLYYLFFSATPKPNSSGYGAKYQMFVATSQYAYKDFKLVDFANEASCGAGNTHSINTSVDWEPYARYVFFEPGWYREFSRRTYGTVKELYNNYAGAIDPHPFVDANGDKYLYWVDNIDENGICVVKMENWLKPAWDTAEKILYAEYYTMDDLKRAKSGYWVEKVSYENSGNLINEGPAVVRHNGKYYLTFSVNDYKENNYQVGQAVADSPRGPFRKLREEEGGLLLSSVGAGCQDISGTGHHSFVAAGNRTYVVYHRHDEPGNPSEKRNLAIDQVEWVTVKDKDGNMLEVMCVNGPTCTEQPSLEAFSGYRNIASEASVSGSGDAACLTDGLLSISKGNAAFEAYLPETTITRKTTFTFDFDTVRTVRAIMIYNSRDAKRIFKNISKIEFVCEREGLEVIHTIDNLAFHEGNYKVNSDGAVSYVIPGSAAGAWFEDLHVRSVRITVDVPVGQSEVGISEVRIFGK